MANGRRTKTSNQSVRPPPTPCSPILKRDLAYGLQEVHDDVDAGMQLHNASAAELRNVRHPIMSTQRNERVIDMSPKCPHQKRQMHSTEMPSSIIAFRNAIKDDSPCTSNGSSGGSSSSACSPMGENEFVQDSGTAYSRTRGTTHGAREVTPYVQTIRTRVMFR